MKKSILSAAAATFLLSAPHLLAASDYLLEIDGIKGESKDNIHPESIELESWSWGLSQSGTISGGGAGTGKVSLQDFHFTTSLSKASPQLMLACASGKHIPKAVLYLRKSGGDGQAQEYYKITFVDVLVSSVSQSAPGSKGILIGLNDPRPTESLSLNFTKMEIEYKSDDGQVTTAVIDPGATATQ